MLTLINTNTMQPAIAPVGLDYIAGAAKKAGIDVDLVDLCLAEKRKLPYVVGRQASDALELRRSGR